MGAAARDRARRSLSAHLRSVGRGFNWLAGAAVIARIVDFSTILIMLALLTKQQVGVASLVMSVGMVVEAFNGLGTSEALIQAPKVTRLQLDTLFWYILGAAVAMGGLVLLAAPEIAAIYGAGGMAAYFLVIAAKQPLVGAALIPLAMMNRDLHYKRIAAVNVCATLAAALTRLGLGAAGAGTWALVAGYGVSGLYTLIGALIAQPFRPRLRFRLAAGRPLMRFGLRAATANIAEQSFKNIDYLLVGWFYGAASLAIYRVAFDVAMEPAMAVGTIVNRAALPVFARIVAARSLVAQAPHLTEIVAWSLRKIAMLVVPLTAGLVLAAGSLTSLLHDHGGHSYAAAGMPLRVLATAAPLRLVVQLLATLMMGAGRPAMAARLSAITLLMLGGGIVTVGLLLPARSGLVAVSAVWLGIYPLLLAWGWHSLHRSLGISPAVFVRAFGTPLLGTAALVAVVQASHLLYREQNSVVALGITVFATALLYVGLFIGERRRLALTA